jgi:hypothetical protein
MPAASCWPNLANPVLPQNILSRHSRPIEFLFALIVAIEQDSLIFIGRIDFAPCDAEIDDLTIIGRGAEI